MVVVADQVIMKEVMDHLRGRLLATSTRRTQLHATHILPFLLTGDHRPQGYPGYPPPDPSQQPGYYQPHLPPPAPQYAPYQTVCQEWSGFVLLPADGVDI